MKLLEVITRGTRAAQPVANTVPAGTLYYITDEAVTERSSGSAWESYSDGGALSSIGGITKLRLPITEVQIEAWSSSPIQLVAAAGADKIIVPLMFAIEVDLTVAYTSTPSMSLIWTGSATNLLDTAPQPSLNSSPVKKFIYRPLVQAITLQVYSSFDPRNKALLLKGSADPTGAGSATAIVNLLYTILTVT